MRFQAVLLLLIGLCLATSNAFFLNKAKILPEKLGAAKVNLVADASAAVGDLKEAGRLKVKALTKGIKAIGTTKLRVLKGITNAKVGAVKPGLTKIVTVQARKVALAKRLLSGISGFVGRFRSLSSPSNLDGVRSASIASGSLVPSFGIIRNFEDNDIFTLYPSANAAPTRINVITIENNGSGSEKSSGIGNNGYAPRPIVVPASSKSHGTPNGVIQPSTSYGVPILSLLKHS